MFGFTVALCAALICICHAHLHPPMNLKVKWIDHVTVNVSWKQPENLPRDCKVKYEVKLNERSRQTKNTYILQTLLAESAAVWVCSVSPSCGHWRRPETELNITAPAPRAAVTDFRCFLSSSDMNCSWVSDPSSDVTLSYRDCGTNPEILKTKFTECSETSIEGQRTVCRLRENFLTSKLCMVANSSKGISTFEAPKALKLPNVKISEEDTELVLTFEPLTVNCLFYNICHSVCGKPRPCQEHRPDLPWKVLHDKSCQYKFWYRAQTRSSCVVIHSDWSHEITLGVTDWTMTVVAVVIPIVVSACVILSCICFRRHKDIICPEVPDPSLIFKEMITGSKDIKPNVSTYTPVQELIEPIVIVPHISHTSGLEPI